MFWLWKRKQKPQPTQTNWVETPQEQAPPYTDLDGSGRIIAFYPLRTTNTSYQDAYRDAECVLQPIGDDFYTVLKDTQNIVRRFEDAHPDVETILDYDHTMTTGDRRVIAIKLSNNDFLFLKMLL